MKEIMEKILTKENLPKFLRVSSAVERIVPFNKYLTRPWRAGELVRVCPFEEQIWNTEKYNPKFSERFVKIIRFQGFDTEQEWTWEWGIFEPLTKKK